MEVVDVSKDEGMVEMIDVIRNEAIMDVLCHKR